MGNNGKASTRRPGRIWQPDQRQVQRSLEQAKREPSLAELEADQEAAEALAQEVTQMCKERGCVIEAQVIIQGTQMVSNVIFRKLPRE